MTVYVHAWLMGKAKRKGPRGRGEPKMRIVVVGDGKVGFLLTKLLAREGHDVVVIDRNEEILRDV